MLNSWCAKSVYDIREKYIILHWEIKKLSLWILNNIVAHISICQLTPVSFQLCNWYLLLGNSIKQGLTE